MQVRINTFRETEDVVIKASTYFEKQEALEMALEIPGYGGLALSEEDKKEFRSLWTKRHMNLPATSYISPAVPGLLGTALGITTVYGYATQQNFKNPKNLFKPAASPDQIHLLPDSNPLAPYVNAAIEHQKPSSHLLTTDFAFANGKFSAVITEPTEYAIDVAKFNQEVQQSFHPAVNTSTTITCSAVSLCLAVALAYSVRSTRKTITAIYDRNFNKPADPSVG